MKNGVCGRLPRWGLGPCVLVCVWRLACSAATINTSNTSLKNEVQHAIDRGIAALVKSQNPEGHWSTADQPAVSALVLVAFEGQPIDGTEKDAVKRGYDFLLKNIHPDGSIHGGKGLV